MKYFDYKWPTINKLSVSYEGRNNVIKGLVGYLIEDVTQQSWTEIENYCSRYDIPTFKDEKHGFSACIAFSAGTKDEVRDMQQWEREKFINSEEIAKHDAKGEYIIKRLFKAYYMHPLQLPDYMLRKYLLAQYGRVTTVNRNLLDVENLRNDKNFIELIADHIGGMTDQFALREYRELYLPDFV